MVIVFSSFLRFCQLWQCQIISFTGYWFSWINLEAEGYSERIQRSEIELFEENC